MKVQNLAIIFLVITIPLIMILSYYLNLQQKTLKLQAEYDTKLAESTKEGIKAFEVNTVDWAEWVLKQTNETDRNNATAAINTFITSLANNLHISGTAKELMMDYLPAIAVTMYDGYFVYTPTYKPVTAEFEGLQIFADDTATGNKVKTDTYKSTVLYVAETGGETYQYDRPDGTTASISGLTTDITKAKKELTHGLNNKITYSARYKKAGGTDVVVDYTLDNKISVYGKVDEASAYGMLMLAQAPYTGNVSRSGYLVYFNKATTIMPRIYVTSADPKEVDINVYGSKCVYNTTYNGTKIDTEVLEEQVLYKDDDGTLLLGKFPYVYDIRHEKLYYDASADGGQGDFFTIEPDKKERQFKNDTQAVKKQSMNGQDILFKSVTVLWGTDDDTVEYKKIYQALNGKDKGKWYIDIKEDSEEAKANGDEELDTELKTKLTELGLDDPEFSAIYKDYSAISYYVEAYAFTNWVNKYLSGTLTQVGLAHVEQQNGVNVLNDDFTSLAGATVTDDFVMATRTVTDIFKINVDNNPEDKNSLFCTHKREIMKNNMVTNLNLAISNYNGRGEYEFTMPELSATDWDQVFNNVSMISFFQGVKIGLKKYNNYAIATSTTNREYVDPNEIFFSGSTDKSFHQPYCIHQIASEKYTGYRSVEYVMKEYLKKDTVTSQILTQLYYYQHDNYTNTLDASSETVCYYCLVNRASYTKATNTAQTIAQTKAYDEALARERYYQMETIAGKVGVMLIYDYNIDPDEPLRNYLLNQSDAPYVNMDLDDPLINYASDLPESQLVETDSIVQISTLKPKITTNDFFIDMSFDSWNTEKDGKGEKYLAGDNIQMYDKDRTLYAMWNLNLSKLPWNRDYYFINEDDAFIGGIKDGDHFDNKSNNPHMADGSVSYIYIDSKNGKNRIQMIGNRNKRGKGAAWTNFESDFLQLSEFQFSYIVNAGHSFNAAGFMFNIKQQGDTLTGYLLSINFNGNFKTLAENNNGAIYKFTYKLGNYIGNSNENGLNFEHSDGSEITRVQSFDLGSYNSDRNSTGDGTINIKVTDTGYRISGSEFTQEYFVYVPASEMNPNSFGFFSDHFGREEDHTCENVGYFKLDDVKILASRK